MTPTKLLNGQIAIVFAVLLLGVWAATQWAAAMLGYQNFKRRVLDPPALSAPVDAGQRQAPAGDWSGRVAPTPAPAAFLVDPGCSGDGSLQHEHCQDFARRPFNAPIPEQLDVLELGDDGEDAFPDALPPGPALAVHAMNEGRGHADLLPRF